MFRSKMLSLFFSVMLFVSGPTGKINNNDDDDDHQNTDQNSWIQVKKENKSKVFPTTDMTDFKVTFFFL